MSKEAKLYANITYITDMVIELTKQNKKISFEKAFLEFSKSKTYTIAKDDETGCFMHLLPKSAISWYYEEKSTKDRHPKRKQRLKSKSNNSMHNTNATNNASRQRFQSQSSTNHHIPIIKDHTKKSLPLVLKKSKKRKSDSELKLLNTPTSMNDEQT